MPQDKCGSLRNINLEHIIIQKKLSMNLRKPGISEIQGSLVSCNAVDIKPNEKIINYMVLTFHKIENFIGKYEFRCHNNVHRPYPQY